MNFILLISHRLIEDDHPHSFLLQLGGNHDAMKLAIIGSRTFSSYPLLCSTMDQWFGEDHTANRQMAHLIDEIVSGGAAGADSLGARWAKEHGIRLTEFIPDWDRFGKSAGFRRNEDIVKAADCVLCFWDGLSRGSGNSLSIAKRLKKTTIIVYF